MTVFRFVSGTDEETSCTKRTGQYKLSLFLFSHEKKQQIFKLGVFKRVQLVGELIYQCRLDVHLAVKKRDSSNQFEFPRLICN